MPQRPTGRPVIVSTHPRGPARRRTVLCAERAERGPGRRRSGVPRRRQAEVRVTRAELFWPVRDLMVWFDGPSDRLH